MEYSADVPSTGPAPASVSRVKIEISVRGKGTATAELARHLSPLTCSALLKALPIEGRIHRFADMFVYAETSIVVGTEKQRNSFRRGDIGFMPSNGGICFIVKDGSTPRLNPIGQVTSNLSALESVQPGDIAEITRLV